MCNRCQLRDEIQDGRDIKEVPIDLLRELTTDFDQCFNYNDDPEARMYFEVVDEINRRVNKRKEYDRGFFK